MSSLDPLYQGILYNTVNTSQQEINTLLKQLETGLKINSAADDPANIYVSEALNFEALENAATETNAQNGLTYLQVAQKAYSDIITELNKIKTLADKALTGNYDSIQIADFQNQITASINTIKNIETGTTFNGIQVFNNSNSVGLVNEHMFAITSKEDVIVTTATVISDRGKDYSEYLTNDVSRYNKIDINGEIALVNDDGTIISFNSIHIASKAQFLAVVSGMTLGLGLDKNYVLDTDIDLTGYDTSGKALFQGDFTGTFDGNGHTISNLTINNTEVSVDADKSYFVCDSSTNGPGVGLFDTVLGAVSNLNLSNINISVAGNVHRAGALAGIVENGANIANVSVASATISGGTDSKGLGGLVGFVSNATISDSSANATVTGAWDLGGLAGFVAASTIKNSASSGSVTCNQASAQTANYYYAGSHLDRMVGGLAGVILSSTMDSNRSSSTVTNSFNYTGGISGMLGSSSVTNSYATGNVTGAIGTVGGFSGDIRSNSSISNCYAQNSVSGGWGVGGFYGSNGQAGVSVGSISNCFYDSTRYAGGFGPAADAANWTNYAGISTADISSHSATFNTVTLNWDKIDVWNTAGASPTLNNIGTHAPITVNSSNVTTIENAQQLVSALNGTTVGKTFILLDNIDLSSLGVKDKALITGTFQGTLEGNGYAISNLQINSTTNDNIGLFENLGAASRVQNVILSDFVIKGDLWVGSLAGRNTGGVIDNVAVVDTNVKGNGQVGGLVGWNGASGTITNSFVSGQVSGDSLSYAMGGLVGNLDGGTISRTFANVDVSGSVNIGGLVGLAGTSAAASISESYARGSVTGQTSVGGLVGSLTANGTITNTYTLGTVTGEISTAGLVGNNAGNVSNSYSLSKVVDSTAVFDITQFQVVATGEIVQGMDQRPNDDFSITYTATNFAGAGTIFAFNSVEDFDKFRIFDTTGSAPSDIALFYEKSAGNVWNGRKLQSTERYQYTQTVLTDPPLVGVPIDADGIDYSIIRAVTGANAGTYAFKTEEDYNNFQAYSTNSGTATNSVDKFYRLDAANDRWYLQNLTITPNAQTYSIQVGVGASIDNMPVTPNGTFNVLWSNAGTNYAFASVEDRDAYASNNGSISLFYTENADGTWHSWNQTASFSPQVIAGVTTADDPQDINEHYTYLTSYAGGTYAFASQEDLDKFNGGTPIGEIAKYYAKATGDVSATPWVAYEVTKSVSVTTNYTAGETVSNVQSAPIDNSIYSIIRPVNIWSGTYTFAFSSETDSYNFNDGINLRGVVGECYYKANNGPTVSWQKCSVVPNPTPYNALAPVDLGTPNYAIPEASDGTTYNYIRSYNGDTYAFKNETEYNNYVDRTAPVEVYFKDVLNGTDHTWQKLTTTTTWVNDFATPTGITCYQIPDVVDSDGQLFSYIHKQFVGMGYYNLYAFKSEEEYHRWSDRFTSGYGTDQGADPINYYRKSFDNTDTSTSDWIGFASTFDDSSRPVDISYGGFASRLSLTPTDSSYNVIAQAWGTTTSAFASERDRDLCIAGNQYNGLVEYDYQSDGTWKQYTYTIDTTYHVNNTASFSTSAVPNDPSFNYLVDKSGQLYAFKSAYENTLFDTQNPYNGMEYYTYDGGGTWTLCTNVDIYEGNITSPGTTQFLTPADPSYQFLFGTLAFADAAAIQRYISGPVNMDIYYEQTSSGLWQGYIYNELASSWNTYGAVIGSSVNHNPEYATRYDDGTNTYYFANEQDRDAFITYQTFGELRANTNDFVYYQVTDYGAETAVQEYNFDVRARHQVSTDDTTTSSVPYQDPEYGTVYNDGTNTYYFANEADRDSYVDYAADGVLSSPQTTNDFTYYRFNDAATTPSFDSYNFNVASSTSSSWVAGASVASIPQFEAEYSTRYNDGTNTYYFANAMDMAAYQYYVTNGDAQEGRDNNFVFWQEVSAMGGNPAVERREFKVSDFGVRYDDNTTGVTVVNCRPMDTTYQYQGQNGAWYNNEALATNSTGGYEIDTYSTNFYQPSGFGPTAELYRQERYRQYTYDVVTGAGMIKPDDNNYNMQYNYGGTYASGAGLYYFNSDNDRQTFINYVNGSTDAFDIKYYFMSNAEIATNDRFFQAYELRKNADPLIISSGGVASSRPDDLQYTAWTNGGDPWNLSGSTRGAAYDGWFMFKSQEDKNKFDVFRMGGDIEDGFSYYKYDGVTWDKFVISKSTTTTTNYNLNVPFGGGNHAGSPNTQGFEVVWRDSGNIDFAFETEADRDNFQKYHDPGTYGTLNSQVDITYYQKTGLNTWQQYRLASGNPTYTVNNTNTNIAGRPNKEGYDWVSGSTAFLNAADMALYNGGSPVGAIDMFYQYNGGTHDWDAYRSVANPITYNRAYNNTASFVMGRPDNEDFATIYNNAGVFYAFKSIAERDTFINDLTESALPGVNKYAPIDRYYRYDTATNQWQDWKITETVTKVYGITANTTPLDGDVGLDYRPNVTDGYSYLLTIGAGVNAGSYAFETAEDRTSFSNFNAGSGTVNTINNYYKLNTSLTAPHPVSGQPIYEWESQSLDYNNQVGYLIGNNAGTVSNSFYSFGKANANYTSDGVTILGTAQILAKDAPMTTWNSTTVWDFTTSRPTLRNPKYEGSDEIDPDNLDTLSDETKYTFRTYDSYVTNDIRLNTALTSTGSFTIATPASAPVGYDAGKRPLVATLTLAGLAGRYISDITVADNADPNSRFTEGKDFVLYTNDNGATWQMDLMSSAIYGKTLNISFAGVLTSSVNEVNSGFNIYLGDNRNLNVKDMSLDLAGRLNFNLTRLDGSRGTLDALEETLNYMGIKKAQLDGEVIVAQNALSNKTSQKTTMNTATGNIRNIDEAKAKVELAKKQLMQEKTDKIIEKFYNLQLTAMQNLLRINTGGNVSSIGNVYQGLTGVNSLYNQNLIDYTYKNMYDLFNEG